MTKVDLMTQLAAKKSGGMLKCVERLPCLMPVADHADVHFALAQIVADLGTRDRDEGEPRIAQLLGDERPEYSLNFVIDPREALGFQAVTSSAATRSVM